MIRRDCQLGFRLLYCRHGKTAGNTEPRVYQGYVDEPTNALNDVGLGQAESAADKLDKLNIDSLKLIVVSPLSRALATGEAFLKRHEDLRDICESWEESAEQHFGSWDNVMVKDLAPNNICHLFYLDQNTVVKSHEPYIIPSALGQQKSLPAECFIENAMRMHGVLLKLNERFPPPTDTDSGASLPLVLCFGHSMAGAALSILLGKGKSVDPKDTGGTGYLGFDGPYIMPNATPVFLAGDAEPASLESSDVAKI